MITPQQNLCKAQENTNATANGTVIEAVIDKAWKQIRKIIKQLRKKEGSGYLGQDLLISKKII